MPDLYQPNWESLSQYTIPRWFMDAKLGIFIHWGVYAVPAFSNEWYPRNMYRRGTPEFEHHRAVWGAHRDFGYKDFIPMFKAEHWDPAAWVQLFQEAGARYIVPVAEHHDGFPMYATDLTPYNAAAMGPCRDIVADMATAVRAAGLKFGVSSHRAFNWRYYTFEDDFDTVDPRNAALYSPAHLENTPASAEFLDNWWSRTRELVDRFEPDLLWFDFGWHEEEFAPCRPRITSYYYNRALEWGREVVLNYKDKFPAGTAVWDIERGKLDAIREEYWQTDTSVSYKSWCYVEDDEFKSVTTLVHDLVDIVSKNGNLLLNVGPRPDGTIPEEVQERLRGLGAWLRVNGEAIYGTRHWATYGEGDTAVVTGHMTERQNAAFGPGDVRFTVGSDALYAILLGWPGAQATVRSLGSGSPLAAARIEAVSLLGAPGTLPWRQSEAGLTVDLPAAPVGEHAYTLKIVLKK